MPLSLSHFLRQQLAALDLSEREFSERSGVGLSHVYQILRGDRKHTRGDTLDKIAAALNMSPAEMAVAMGRASGEVSSDETEVLALYREIPHEDRHTVKSMLRGLKKRGVTDEPDDLVRHKMEEVPSVRPRRRPYEHQSVTAQIARYGFQPAIV